MKHLTFNNGHKMPIVGLGTFLADDPKAMEEALEKALEIGYRHFDTATLYRNESVVGKVIKKWLDSGKVKREELFITTKLPWNGMSPERVEQFLGSSLKALQLDYVDLYLIHWPIGLIYTSEDDLIPMQGGKALFDITTDLEAIWKAMETQVEGGKTKSIGISNFNESQVERIMKIARILPTNHQFEMHVYFQQKDLLETCKKHGIRVVSYGSLGSAGRLGHKFSELGGNNPFPPTIVMPVLEDPDVNEIAEKHNKTAAQILLKFLVQQNIAVIPKTLCHQRLQENSELFDFEISKDDMEILKSLDKGEDGRSFLGFKGQHVHPECPWES